MKFLKDRKLPKKRWIVVGGLGLMIGCGIMWKALGPKPVPTVRVQNVLNGEAEQKISLTGTVESEEQKTYFSPMTAKIASCEVHMGDMVEAGQVLLTYDAADVEKRVREASLQKEEAEYTYQDLIGKSGKQAGEYQRSGQDIAILEQQVQEARDRVQYLKNNIMDLNCFLREAQLDGKEKYALELQDRIAKVSNEMEQKQQELTTLESQLAEQKSIHSSSEAAMLTAAGKKQAEAQKELASLQAEKITTAAGEVQNGLRAEFSGVVVDVKAVDGSVVESGSEILTIASIESVCVEITLSKSDLQKVREGQKAEITINGKNYQGTVTMVSHNAQKNEKGATVVEGKIRIDDPDEDIFLGLEAKVTVYGTKEENAMLIPMDAVCVGTDGSFVYVAEDGIVQKRMIEIGISSAEMVSVKSGLDGSEKIITESYDLGEGMQVHAVEE